jgi:hypothetical protein
MPVRVTSSRASVVEFEHFSLWETVLSFFIVQNLGFKAYDTGFSGLIGEGWLIILVQDMECYR